MNILITGGAGFVGSNLASKLMKDNFVVVYDDFSIGTFDNLQHLKFTGKVVKGDILDTFELKKTIEKYKIDQIYHLAACSSSQMFEKNLKRSIKVNIMGTLNVFETARKCGIKRVVYASSSTVNAGQTLPFSESTPVEGKNFYSYTKYSNENLAKLYSKEGYLETVGARFFSVYGPNDIAKGEFANFLDQFIVCMKKGESPVVYDDGKQGRDFIHAEDVAEALILMMNTPEANGEVINVGTGIQTNILDLISEINKLLGKNIEPTFKPNPIKGYCVEHQASTVKLFTILNFKPKILLDEGLKKQIEELNENIVSK